MARLTNVSRADMDEAQGALYDKLIESRSLTSGGSIGGPFDPWLLHGEMARRIVGLGNLFRFRTSVSRRYIELAILHTGQFWCAQFEWYAHEPMARKAGVPETVISALKAGETPDFEDDGDAATFWLCQEIEHTHRVSASTFARAEQAFGQQGVAELVNLIGYYTMVSMTLNTFAVPLPEGAEYPFPDNPQV